MSDHKLRIDVQKLANAIQEIRAYLEIIEEMVQKALLEENQYE